MPCPRSTAVDGNDGGGSSDDGGGLGWIAQATSEKPTSTTPSDRQEGPVSSPLPVDLLAAALSGDSRIVEHVSSATGGNAGASNSRAMGGSSGSSAVKQSGTTTNSTATVRQPTRPGEWLTTALAPGNCVGTSSTEDTDTEIREKGVERGDGKKRDAVETASIGVQWEEDGGTAAGAPSLNTTGGLPPWAKPYARHICPPTEAVEDDDSRGEIGERVTMESSGIQCGESVLGGRISDAAGVS